MSTTFQPACSNATLFLRSRLMLRSIFADQYDLLFCGIEFGLQL
jgi:hypothetical protein